MNEKYCYECAMFFIHSWTFPATKIHLMRGHNGMKKNIRWHSEKNPNLWHVHWNAILNDITFTGGGHLCISDM